MFFKKLTIMLALMLTIFAVDANAITCSPPPAGCSASDEGQVTVQFTGPGGTISCTYKFCFCYKCPNPILDPSDTLMKISVYDIQSVDGCENIDLDFVYSEIRQSITSPTFLETLCPIPICGNGVYKYIEYRIPTCWYSLYVGNYLHFRPCEGCTAECVNITRVCKDLSGYYFIEPVSSTRIGEITCDDCEETGWGLGETEPSLPGGCFHVCD